MRTFVVNPSAVLAKVPGPEMETVLRELARLSSPTANADDVLPMPAPPVLTGNCCNTAARNAAAASGDDLPMTPAINWAQLAKEQRQGGAR